jgi:hypothetical protein
VVNCFVSGNGVYEPAIVFIHVDGKDIIAVPVGYDSPGVLNKQTAGSYVPKLCI